MSSSPLATKSNTWFLSLLQGYLRPYLHEQVWKHDPKGSQHCAFAGMLMGCSTAPQDPPNDRPGACEAEAAIGGGPGRRPSGHFQGRQTDSTRTGPGWPSFRSESSRPALSAGGWPPKQCPDPTRVTSPRTWPTAWADPSREDPGGFRCACRIADVDQSPAHALTMLGPGAPSDNHEKERE